MELRRDMYSLRKIVREQGCRIKRWKLTRQQALVLVPTREAFHLWLAGHGYYLGISVKITDR